MDIHRFKSVLATLADGPDQIVLDGGHLVVQIGQQTISAEVLVREGGVAVREGEITKPAAAWLAHRIGMLDLLAQRIAATFPPTRPFVTPQGTLLGTLQDSATDSESAVLDASTAALKFLARRPAGSCSVLYLTSDAGEGKTTLIHNMAHRQAGAYLERKAEWLLIPISLGGRPFLHFDDVVVAALMNQLRFQHLYFDAFIEFVKLGLIVPALDGFEEIFIETAEGEAVSSLGTLIRKMQGEGTLLIAARRAYFEFRGLETQSRLIDALPDVDVSFSRLRLAKWEEPQFIEYCTQASVRNPENLYRVLEARLSKEHPLLTRAVLVRRVAELAKADIDYVSLLATVSPNTADFFNTFIDAILQREVAEKWIDKHGEPPHPLLTTQQHHDLLGMIAEEMWASKVGELSGEMIDSIADLFCSQASLSPSTARQVVERLKQHALLSKASGIRSSYRFDHESFREFFLGEQLGRHLEGARAAELRRFIRVDQLPSWAVDTAVRLVPVDEPKRQSVLRMLGDLCSPEAPASFVRENSGALALPLLDGIDGGGTVVKDMVFPPNALLGRTLANVSFVRCYFRNSSIERALLKSVHFGDCEFEQLDLSIPPRGLDVTISGEFSVRSTIELVGDEPIQIFDPARISSRLSAVGFSRHREAGPAEGLDDVSEEMKIVQKVLLLFTRTTQVSEATMTLRLGVFAPLFFSRLLADLLSHSVLREVQHRGAGNMRRFRLGAPLSVLTKSLTESRGGYEAFLASASRASH